MENELAVTSAFYILSSKMVFQPIILSVLLQLFYKTLYQARANDSNKSCVLSEDQVTQLNITSKEIPVPYIESQVNDYLFQIFNYFFPYIRLTLRNQLVAKAKNMCLYKDFSLLFLTTSNQYYNYSQIQKFLELVFSLYSRFFLKVLIILSIAFHFFPQQFIQ